MEAHVDPTLYLLVAVVALVVLGVVAVRFARRPKRRRLRDEYARLVGLPPAQAYEALEHRVEALMQSHPGHPLEWYLDYVLAELKRDRR